MLERWVPISHADVHSPPKSKRELRIGNVAHFFFFFMKKVMLQLSFSGQAEFIPGGNDCCLHEGLYSQSRRPFLWGIQCSKFERQGHTMLNCPCQKIRQLTEMNTFTSTHLKASWDHLYLCRVVFALCVNYFFLVG